MRKPDIAPEPVDVFFSYAHADEELRNKLARHLSLLMRRGVIRGWDDRKIEAGAEWAGDISEQLNRARIILLLVSSDFLASDYCSDIEVARAMARHKSWRGDRHPDHPPSVRLDGRPVRSPTSGSEGRTTDHRVGERGRGVSQRRPTDPRGRGGVSVCPWRRQRGRMHATPGRG